MTPWIKWKWLRMGYSHGTYIYQPVSVLFKQGLKEWPELYFGLFHAVFGIIVTNYIAFRYELGHEFVARYKRKYTVFRPDDDRVKLYPRNFVTDKHYLGPDQPEKLTDVERIKQPGTSIHVNDPRIRKSIGDFFEGNL